MLALIGLAALALANDQPGAAQPGAPASVLFAVIKREYLAGLQAKDSHSKALHAYLLNDAADRYAYRLNQDSMNNARYQADPQLKKREMEPEVQRANEYGASILWCEFSGDLTAASNGYEDYLSRWPNGPYAEEAWWRGKLLHKLNSCVDAVGSEEETADYLRQYEEFLRHFPHGKHERQAREALQEFRKDLESYRNQSPHQ